MIASGLIHLYDRSMVDLYSLCSKIHYKPTYHLQVIEVAPSIYSVWWEYQRPDSRIPDSLEWGESGAVLINMAEDPDEEMLVRMIFGMTEKLEEHEAREFFTYDNLRPFDPHTKLIPERIKHG